MFPRISLFLFLIIFSTSICAQSNKKQEFKYLVKIIVDALNNKESQKALKLSIVLEQKALAEKNDRIYIDAPYYQFHALRQLGRVNEGIEKLKAAAEYADQRYDRYNMIAYEAHNRYASVLVARGINCEEVIEIAMANLAAYCEGALSDSFNLEYLESLPQQEYKHNTWALKALRLMREANRCLCKDAPTETCQQQQLAISKAAYSIIERVKADIHPKGVKKQVFSVTIPYAEYGLDAIDWLVKENGDKSLYKDALEFVEQNKSAMLMEAFQSQTATSLAQIPENLAKREEFFEKRSNKLLRVFSQIGTSSERDSIIREWRKLSIKNAVFKDSLKQLYPEYYDLRFNLSVTTADQLQAYLSDKTALIEYYVGKNALYIVCLTASDIKYKKLELKQTDLDASLGAFHAALSNYSKIKQKPEASYEKVSKYGQELYQLLIGDLLAEFKDIDHLIIVPDAQINYIPFEALLTEEPSEQDYKKLPYLIQKYKIQYASSSSLLLKKVSRKQLKGQKNMLGVAAHYDHASKAKADFPNRGPEYTQLRKALESLPAAREEVEALEVRFDGDFWFEKNATERSFKANAKDYAVIHLAMHGMLNPKKPELSSLAFTEDGDKEEDNFLEAQEISSMQLNADLVVLSACETGYGKFEQGEGVMSMARAFMYAGVPTLVVSLWQVNDASTSRIMQSFYAKLAEGLDKAEALRQAKLSYLKDSPQSMIAHPAFWSPFVLMGDEKAIDLKTKGERFSALPILAIIGGLILVLILGLWFFSRRKTRPSES